MRTNKSGGFTLIELLIVIAIIGILAAVLIPNLLGARQQAQIRAAQAWSSTIFTAVTAELAEDIDLQPDDASINGVDCLANTTAGNAVYEWAAAPGNVTACGITGAADGLVEVTVTIPEGDIINGDPQF